MGKKVKEYKAGDFIFAKVKGYPAWPARIQRQNGKKYFVYFYGTGETANLPTTSIFDYATNKEKFLSKSVKRRDFNDGVTQIEYDFANNVPIEDVVGVPAEMPAEGADETLNDTGNETLDETAADTSAADETMEEAANTTEAPEPPVEDSDDAALVIDEGKQQGKLKKGKEVKTPAKAPAKDKPAAPKEAKTPKAKDVKTPRGKAKKEESADEDVEEKKDEEIVSRSGRKIRPKRYIDEQTEENTTLPSPAPKKRRGTSPVDKEAKEKEQKEKPEAKERAVEKSIKQYNAVSQSELQELKEPFKPADAEKENILITYLPSGQYIGIKLFQSRPSSFKSDSSRLQWDKQAASNAITLKMQLERGQITPQSISAQLVMDLNLSDEEKAALDKERETDEKKSRVQFLKTEMKLIELDAKVKTCLCLEKADTELCLKLLDELMELEIKPLMLLKHPTCLETVKRMRAYVGNTPRWRLSEAEALQFSKQAHSIRKAADRAYTDLKGMFTTPDGASFWEHFSERVLQFKKATAKLNADELLELVHEPLEMSTPSSLTMKSAIDAANDEETTAAEKVESPQKKAKTPAKTKKSANNTPSKPALKRQSSRNKQEDTEKEQKKSEEESDKTNEVEKDDSEPEKKKVNKSKGKVKTDKKDEVEKNDKSKEKTENSDKSTDNAEKSDKTTDKEENSDKTNDDDVTEKSDAAAEQSDKNEEKVANDVKMTEKEISNDNARDSPTEDKEEAESKVEEVKSDEKEEESKEVVKNGKAEDKAEEKKEPEEKKEVDEPRAKRSRGENKKTEAPTPRSPIKRKSKM